MVAEDKAGVRISFRIITIKTSIAHSILCSVETQHLGLRIVRSVRFSIFYPLLKTLLPCRFLINVREGEVTADFVSVFARCDLRFTTRASFVSIEPSGSVLTETKLRTEGE